MFGKRNALSTAASKRNVGNTAVRDRIRMFEQRENVNEVKEDRQNPRCSTNKELNPRADAGKNYTANKTKQHYFYLFSRSYVTRSIVEG